MPLRQPNAPLVTHWRNCHQCGGQTCVLLPEGATELDVTAEFSGQGREVGRYGDCEGVVCHGCAEVLWSEDREQARWENTIGREDIFG